MGGVFEKVVVVGPDYRATGGISSVISGYRQHIDGLSFIKSNSRHGFICGVVNLIGLLFRLPFARISGRKILHIHSASGKSFVRKSIIVLWGRALGFKIVFHCHGGMMKEYVGRVGVRRVRNILVRCDVVIVLSQTWKAWYEQTFNLRNIKQLNNTISIVPQRIINKKQSGKIRFLFLGEICERKGVWDLVEAARILNSDFYGKFEVVIGGGGEKDRLSTEISDNGLEDVVKPAGWITGSAKMGYLGNADVMVLPSYVEGLPISILEGCAFGLPAISTTVGGIPDIIKDENNGILIAPGDVAALATAMRKFIENPSLIESYSYNALKAFAPYAIHEVKEKLRSIYENVLLQE
ncbi:MAG: glycosyltransferase family 4 protein [Duncaniella sp.]|nr:glycosyltransferase family 4 protein [Duncaniella sp.]